MVVAMVKHYIKSACISYTQSIAFFSASENIRPYQTSFSPESSKIRPFSRAVFSKPTSKFDKSSGGMSRFTELIDQKDNETDSHNQREPERPMAVHVDLETTTMSNKGDSNASE